MSKKAETTGTASPADAVQDEVRSLASDTVQAVKGKAAEFVDEQKASAADQVEDVARVLDQVSERVPLVGTYVREAAATAHRASSTLRDRDVDNLLDDLGRLAARRPAVLIAASVVSGFALARFLKSSAERHAARQRDRGQFARSSANRSEWRPREAPQTDIGRVAAPSGAPGNPGTSGPTNAPDQTAI